MERTINDQEWQRRLMPSSTNRQKTEDVALVDCLVELTKDSSWNGENGFRTGYLQHLKKLVAEKRPSSNLKVTPHIE